ncbi:hypothetical protein PpBr36_03501 [Pyricularia pennisetigena]|uniref:hypothetical protein n=1 Tax=Pyricularia pennisetigena TaxID=1578925 RepID=UPI00114DF324|nr:hypothetical protein PpBr36_03501 [Pyricularia pennisetigena]TLS30003.1 hypothetical protein PpBr36_03501 [Pyricularia pennisetigena]
MNNTTPEIHEIPASHAGESVPLLPFPVHVCEEAHDALEVLTMRGLKVLCDEPLENGTALNHGSLVQLVRGTARTTNGTRSRTSLPRLIDAPDAHTTGGVGAAPDAAVEALKDGRDGDVLVHARQDGDAVRHLVRLELAAVGAEEGVVDHLVDRERAPLEALLERVRLHQRLVRRVEGSQYGRRWEVWWERV